MEEKLRVGNFAIVESDGQVRCDICHKWRSGEYIILGEYLMCPHCIEEFALFMSALQGFNELKNKIKGVN